MTKSRNLNTAIVLAGGLGTRLRSVVNNRPKPMADVAGKPFLEHLLGYWSSQGIERFIISVGYLGKTISDYFGYKFNGSAIEYVVEAKPLGTGGALLRCQQQLNLEKPFILLNGDTFFAVNKDALNFFAENLDADWVLSLFLTTEVNRYLPCQLDFNGKLSFLLPPASRDLKKDCWANGGVYWVNPRALKQILNAGSTLSLESDILINCQNFNQKLYGFKSSQIFIDIGIPEDYFKAQTMTCFN